MVHPTRQTDDGIQGQARILSNTTYLLAASFLQKFISLGYVVYYFRTLGKSGAGDFEPVRSAIPIALLLVDFALSTVLTREIGRDPERARRFLGTVLAIKIIMAAVVATIGLVVFRTLPLDQTSRMLIPIASLVVLLDMFTTTFTATFRGLQIFLYEAIGIVLTQIATVSFGLASFRFGWGLRGLMFSLVAGSLVNFFFIGTMLRRRLGSFFRFRLEGPLVRRFFAIAWPILGAALLAKLFTYTDRYLLLNFGDKGDFAVYTAAHKVPFALEFIAAAFAASLLPAMSRYFSTNRDQLRTVLQQAFRYLILISIPLAVGIFVLAQPLVVKLLGRSYLESITPLRTMILALPFIFLNFPLGSFLIATNRQIWNTINLGLAVAVNVTLNIFLQPALKVEGAAIAVLVTYVVLFALGLVQVVRVVRLAHRELLRTILNAILAAATMAVPLALLQRTFSPYFLILPAGMLYAAALFLIGGIRTEDLRILFRALTRRAS